MQDIAAIVGEFVEILFLAVQQIASTELLLLPIPLNSVEYNLHGDYIAREIPELKRGCFTFGDDLRCSQNPSDTNMHIGVAP